MASAPMSGLMAVNTKDTGSRISCTDREFTPGRTGASTMVNMKTIRKVGRVYSTGQMVGNMQADGRMASSTVRPFSQRPMTSLVKVSGIKVNESVGQMTSARVQLYLEIDLNEK